ncbi:N-acetyltransferase [Polynucleobacter sp. JS-Mosq-20-D10]|uniref:acyltransferase n=1 Tax=Polynucleobacter sp. JS-Mosq-20-D10 TaxID=2576922 RepID=UPI001BFCD688|nr:acyltransferase [Polynucleobacter sp. JS-Mosq-20-D10]QWE00770.1 N-acetyltransferase [Polynucleobacter sp. JS-Mosq-20-D10]
MSSEKIYESKIIDVTFGVDVTIINPVNIYECFIGDKAFIGPFVEIQKGVIIGASSKIQSHTFICELVEIGEYCFVGHGVMFINDLFEEGAPARGNRSFWKRTRIESNVSIGSNATILPVFICSNTVIGAGSVVTKDIVVPGVYAGNPAKLIRKIILG